MGIKSYWIWLSTIPRMSTDGSDRLWRIPKEEHGYYIFKEGDREPNNWRSVFGGSVWEKVEGRSEYYFHAFGKKQPDLNWENETLRKKLYEMVNWCWRRELPDSASTPLPL